ncbi:hypothetical protein HXY32_05945 [Candidatus Bathyarchaeota archaeon]|nr:hypothetical protein [Candidatus Bathyarchaeota archaeon]
MKFQKETVINVHVAENSPLANKTLKEAKIPDETGMWVLAIRRKGKCI